MATLKRYTDKDLKNNMINVKLDTIIFCANKIITTKDKKTGQENYDNIVRLVEEIKNLFESN